MVKNIISVNKKAIKFIPQTIVHKILCEYHGKKRASAIIKQKTLKSSDIDEIEFSDGETNFMKYLNYIANSDNQNKLITKFIHDDFKQRSNINFNVISTMLSKYKKYLDISSVSKIFDNEYRSYINKSTLYFSSFNDCDTYYTKNEYTKLDEEEINEKIFTKINLEHDYDCKSFYNRFILKEFFNFLKWKSQDGQILEDYIYNISYKTLIKDMEVIKKTHNDIESISKQIDFNIMDYAVNTYNIDYLLSQNEHLNTSLCNYLNMVSTYNIKQKLKLVYTNQNMISNRNIILQYKPLSTNYEFIKERFKYYPAKMVQYLNFMKEYSEEEIKTKQMVHEKVGKINKKFRSSKYKHEIEIVDV